MKFDSLPNSILVGSILGDGCIKKLQKLQPKSSYWISQHSSKLEYLKWLHYTLSEIYRVNEIKKKTGYEQHYFTLQSSYRLGVLRKLFYPEGKKIIPNCINKMLVHPAALAVWYMDDGTLDNRAKYHKNSMIASYCFSFDDCSKLRKTLADNFSLNVSVTKCTMRGKVYPRIYVPSSSMRRFIDIVKPYTHECFKYKLP